jgi:hypothetical protein
MTEDELKAQQAGKSNQRASNKKNQQAETFINTDLTEDYNSGRELIRQRVKAFGAGMKDEMELVQKALKGFSGGRFVIAEATYQRPMLAPSEEQARESVMSLIYAPSSVSQEVA